MKRYEYVKKRDYTPVKVELNEILQRVNSWLRNNTEDMEVSPELIGSGRRHLITYEVGGNRGFDFDYNLFLPELEQGKLWISKVVHNNILNALRYAVSETGWSDPEESTSVFTIKYKDKKNSRILYSCDFAVTYWDDDGNLKYLYYDKKQNRYDFKTRSLAKDIDSILDFIFDEYGQGYGWQLVRDKYLQLKNSNRDSNKKSFVLYYEAVNNVCNEIDTSDDDEDDVHEPMITGARTVHFYKMW